MPEHPEEAWAAARKLYVADPEMEVSEFEALLDTPSDPRLRPPRAELKPPPRTPPRPSRPAPTPRPARPVRPRQPFDVRGALTVLGFWAVAFYVAPLIMLCVTLVVLVCIVAMRQMK